MVASNVLRLFLFGFTPPGAGSLSFDFSLQSRCWSLKVEGAVGRGMSSLSKVHLLLPRGERVRGWGTLCTCLIFTVTAWEGCGINYFCLGKYPCVLPLGDLVFRSGQNVQNSASPGIQADVSSPGSHSSWPAGDRRPGHSPRLSDGALPDFAQSALDPGPVSQSPRQSVSTCTGAGLCPASCSAPGTCPALLLRQASFSSSLGRRGLVCEQGPLLPGCSAGRSQPD